MKLLKVREALKNFPYFFTLSNFKMRPLTNRWNLTVTHIELTSINRQYPHHTVLANSGGTMIWKTVVILQSYTPLNPFEKIH